MNTSNINFIVVVYVVDAVIDMNKTSLVVLRYFTFEMQRSTPGHLLRSCKARSRFPSAIAIAWVGTHAQNELRVELVLNH